jgi:hypothetical protein
MEDKNKRGPGTPWAIRYAHSLMQCDICGMGSSSAPLIKNIDLWESSRTRTQMGLYALPRCQERRRSPSPRNTTVNKEKWTFKTEGQHHHERSP